MLHDERLALPGWLMPRLPPEIDRDPFALVLGATAAGLALAYLVAAMLGARARARAAILAFAAAALVVAPTLGFVAMGAITGRPYGQDGGVVQLPLAMDKILAGESPHGADYSATMLGRQSRVSDFWAERGGNPILRHHAYLGGTHLLMLPFYLLGRAVGLFDPRFVTLIAWGLAAWLAARLVVGEERKLIAAAAVLVNPLVYWQQIFGANDILVAALLLLSLAVARTGKTVLAAAVLGAACGTKQLAWPFAPFLLAHLAGVSGWRDVTAPRRLLVHLAATVGAFLVVVLPVAALDFRAFWGDIVVYNVGLPGGDNYPLGGTPGFGFANFLIYFGKVASLRDHVSFTPFYVLLIPIGLLLARAQFRANTAGTALLCGAAALLLSLYFSRVVHPNYLILAATLLPLALLMGARVAADVVIAPLLLLLLAVEVAENAVLQATWQDAVAARMPAYATSAWRGLLPRAGLELSADPLGLLLSAVAAACAIAILAAGVLGASARLRVGLVATAVVLVVIAPTVVGMRVARASGSYRAAHPWAVALRGDAAPPAREAWSASFRLDPPAELDASRGWPAAGPVLRALPGARDARGPGLIALGVLALFAATLRPPAWRPLALAVLLLAPPMAVGTAFGAGSAIVLIATATACVLAARGRPKAAVVTALVGFAIALAFVRGPGIGIVNFAAYFGRDAGWWPVAVAIAAGAVLPWVIANRASLAGGRFALAAAGTTALLWFLPGTSPHDVAVPIGLLALEGMSSATPPDPEL